MRTILKSLIAGLLALLLAASAALAQDRSVFRQEELDQMLAPVALYPDSLLAQILMAATYPLEVVQAARWLRANPGLEGQEAVTAVEPMDWDLSVKSLAAFPRILEMMDAQLDWTERLGEAFLAQQEDVMNTVQGLRRRAEAAGNLNSGERMQVVRQGETIVIEPPAPDIVYVPYYNPAAVYGPWWWPAYPPVDWAEPLSYYVVPAHRPAFLWGAGIAISPVFFFGHFDWPRRRVVVAHTHHFDPARIPSAWRHDPVHRRAMPFRYVGPHMLLEPRGAVGARHDSVRSSAVQPERRGGDNRPAAIRQPRAEARGAIVVDRYARVPTGSNGDRAPARFDDRRVGSLAGTTHGQMHNAQPERRSDSQRRFAPQADDHRGERGQTLISRARGVEPRPAGGAPIVRPAPRPVVATATVRSEPRAAVLPLDSRGDPRRAAQVHRRTEPRNDVGAVRQRIAARESTPAPPRPAAGNPVPRLAASASGRAPHADSRPLRGGIARGQGNPHEQSAHRDSGRRP